jgi:hypothetical protein
MTMMVVLFIAMTTIISVIIVMFLLTAPVSMTFVLGKDRAGT